jgi:hypothetical protein
VAIRGAADELVLVTSMLLLLAVLGLDLPGSCEGFGMLLLVVAASAVLLLPLLLDVMGGLVVVVVLGLPVELVEGVESSFSAARTHTAMQIS